MPRESRAADDTPCSILKIERFVWEDGAQQLLPNGISGDWRGEGLRARRRAQRFQFQCRPPLWPCVMCGIACIARYTPHNLIQHSTQHTRTLRRNTDTAGPGKYFGFCVLSSVGGPPASCILQVAVVTGYLAIWPGRYLVRPSDSLFLAPQSDLEKNQNAVRKGLARNAQIRGVFGSPP
jgi:hypothetical protein